MSIIGRIKEFDKTKESFESYVERLENYMVANQIKKEQKVAVLLTAIGPETYGLLRNLVTPEKPDSKSYQELVNTLQEHLNRVVTWYAGSGITGLGSESSTMGSGSQTLGSGSVVKSTGFRDQNFSAGIRDQIKRAFGIRDQNFEPKKRDHER